MQISKIYSSKYKKCQQNRLSKPGWCISRYYRLLFVSLILSGYSYHSHAELIIHHIDVNMGDATFIIDTDTKKTLLVDAGNRSYGKKAVLPLLKSLNINKVNYFVATHYDSDHIGGFDELVDSGISFEHVLDRGNFTHRLEVSEKTGRKTQYGEYVAAAGNFRKTIAPECVKNNDKDIIFLGEQTSVEIVAVGGFILSTDCSVRQRIDRNKESSKKKDNALSIAMVIRHHEFSYFIGGDLTGGGKSKKDIETFVAPRVGNVDVLKVSHHASSTSSNLVFLQTLLPESAIISVGDGGVNLRYKLPRQDVLDRIDSLSTKPTIYSTHRGNGGFVDVMKISNSNIMIYTDGTSYTINGDTYRVDEHKNN